MKQNQEDYMGKVRYSAILPFLDVLHMSITTSSYRFRHQMNTTNHFSLSTALIFNKTLSILTSGPHFLFIHK